MSHQDLLPSDAPVQLIDQDGCRTEGADRPFPADADLIRAQVRACVSFMDALVRHLAVGVSAGAAR